MRCHVLQALLHVLEEGLHHLLLEGFQELVELPLGLRLGELVALERADAPRRARRHLIQTFHLLVALRARRHALLDALALHL